MFIYPKENILEPYSAYITNSYQVHLKTKTGNFKSTTEKGTNGNVTKGKHTEHLKFALFRAGLRDLCEK